MITAKGLGACALSLCLLVAPGLGHTQSDEPLWTLAPEEQLSEVLVDQALDSQRAPVQLRKPWYALRLHGQALEISSVARTRLSKHALEMSVTFAPSEPASAPSVSTPYFLHTLDLPPAALMAMRASTADGPPGDAGLKALLGRHANTLPSPALLTAQWKQALVDARRPQAVERWDVFTDVQRRADGQLLAGSMRLLARKLDEPDVMELLPAAHGMVFQRQELLWLGWLPGGTRPSFVLKRTWLTGEEEFVVGLNQKLAKQTTDPDNPYRAFSSGVAETESHPLKPAGQKRAYPSALSNPVLVAFDASEWSRQREAALKTPLMPRRLLEQTVDLNGSPVKVWAEYLPRLQRSEGSRTEASSATEQFWGGDVAIKVSFRGKTTVLMEAGYLEDPMQIRIGLTQDGEVAIHMDYVPHYNNSFTRWWVWDDASARFRRWLDYQSQGC